MRNKEVRTGIIKLLLLAVLCIAVLFVLYPGFMSTAGEPGQENAGGEQEEEQGGFAAGAGEVIELDGGGVLSYESVEFAEDVNINEALESDLLVCAGAERGINEAAQSAEPLDEPPKYYGYYNLGVASVSNHLNIREKPVDGKLVGKMSNGDGCEILSIEDGWAHVKSGKVEGYVSMEYLLDGAAALAVANQTAKPIATVTTDALRVREQPNTDCPVVTTVAKGEELVAVEESDGWVRLDLDGDDAYVSADYVDVEKRLFTAITITELLYGAGVSDVRVDLCEYAKQFIGNRYVWGGTSLTKGVDCSGFTMQIYKRYGVSLPHHAASQAGKGKTIKASQLKPGDLVFYAKGGKINHVAIYIGNGQVVHASSPKTGIKISNYNYRAPAKMISLLP